MRALWTWSMRKTTQSVIHALICLKLNLQHYSWVNWSSRVRYIKKLLFYFTCSFNVIFVKTLYCIIIFGNLGNTLVQWGRSIWLQSLSVSVSWRSQRAFLLPSFLAPWHIIKYCRFLNLFFSIIRWWVGSICLLHSLRVRYGRFC